LSWFTRLLARWSSLPSLTGSKHRQEHQSIRGELSGLRDLASREISEIRHEIERIAERSRRLAEQQEEIRKLQDPAANRLAGEIQRLDRAVSGARTYARQESDWITGELHQLHSLVTTRLAVQLQYVNKEIYAVKKGLYHAELAVSPDAFNGQFSKHRIFRDLCAVLPIDVFVETGANSGATTHFLAGFGKPVYAVEIDPGFYERAKTRVQEDVLVDLRLGDSPDFLCQLVEKELSEDLLIFFYLDAHWHDHLPLADELKIIAAHHPRAIVMIDDFKVEDDPDYGFDSYGGGQEVTLEFLERELGPHSWQAFFPKMASAQDHMATDILPPRGTSVMACDPAIAAELTSVPSLRQWQRPTPSDSA
jgi:hypothetical protein